MRIVDAQTFILGDAVVELYAPLALSVASARASRRRGRVSRTTGLPSAVRAAR